jgi:hypothetical protein
MLPKNRAYYFFLVNLVFLVTLINCTSGSTTQKTAGQVDTIEFDGGFFSNERICVKANDSTVFQKEIITSKKMIYVRNYLVIPKRDTIKLSIQTFIGSNKYIDTTFFVASSFGGIRAIGASICYPRFVPFSSLINKEPNWGYLPPDLCKRYISIQLDSMKYITF